MQDTAHIPSEPVIGFFKALGLDSWSRMAGKKDSSQLAARHPLRLSIEGKNTSIERDYFTAFQMADAAAGRPVFYPVGVTNVGRHQMKGLNPQNNKLLRAMILRPIQTGYSQQPETQGCFLADCGSVFRDCESGEETPLEDPLDCSTGL